MHHYSEAIPELYPDRIGFPATVIGAGGIGSTLVPMLVRAGVQYLMLWDDDIVEPKNLEMQNFRAQDLGKAKAKVVAMLACEINPKASIEVQKRRFNQADILDGVVLCAVDSIQSRRAIFEAVQKQPERVPLLVDGRLTRKGDFIDLYCIDPRSEMEMENYERSLFEPSCALKSPRADSMTAHVPYMLAGLIGEALAVWVKDRSHPWKVTYDSASHHAERYYAAAN